MLLTILGMVGWLFYC